jgi:hypothetical protein
MQWFKPIIKGAISLDIHFNMRKPASWSQKQKVRQEGSPHVKKPDFCLLSGVFNFFGSAVYLQLLFQG